MTTIDYLPDDILREIFKEAPNCAMIIRTVCRRWYTLAPTFRTSLAALHWRDVNSMEVSKGHIYVHLSIEYDLRNNIQYFTKIGAQYMCEIAARYGNLFALQLARARGHSWDKWTCIEAATEGQLEVLQWAYANGCPVDHDAVKHAAQAHHPILDWLREQK